MVWAGTPRLPSHWKHPPALLVGFQGIPGLAELSRHYKISWVFPRVSSCRDMPGKTSHRRKPILASSSRCGAALALLEALSGWQSSSPYLPSTLVPCRPAEETHFARLYPASCFYGHDPKTMTIGEGKNVEWLVNWALPLLAHLLLYHNISIQRPLYYGCGTSRHLNSSTWSRWSPLTWRVKMSPKACICT